MTACIYCGARTQDGAILYRQNPKGQPGIFACENCRVAPVDPEVELVAKAIQEGQKKT